MHDVIVTPLKLDEAPLATSLLLGELSRAIEFGRSATSIPPR